MSSSAQLLHVTITTTKSNPCAPKPNPSSFSCSMPRPPNRNRRPRRHRNPNRPTIAAPTTATNPFYYPSSFSSESNPDTLEATFDLHYLHNASTRLLSSADAVLQDLRTLITVDPDNRLIVSCRPNTLRFVGNLVAITFAVVLGFRVLVGLVRLGFGGRSGHGKEGIVVRRDRSLGGKEVVVGRVEKERVDNLRKKKSFGMLDNPVSIPKRSLDGLGRIWNTRGRVWEKKLPGWWPSSVLPPLESSGVDKEYYQGEAQRLVRAITDNRMVGKDIVEDDIIHLRQICRTSRAQASFDTTNTRDSFYRVSVDFVLNTCSRAPSHSICVQIEGEDARQFIAGLAENIGLDKIRAARMVSAAVAARTRSRFLGAWALVMQSKHAEAVVELSKICLLLQIFPPEESSPEMEMVARGLEKHLKLDQRQFLMSMLVGICSEESQRRAAEALGLISSFSRCVGDDDEQ